MNRSPDADNEIARINNEIARLMRDPNARRSGERDHYDPNQPRVPAGNSKGGQWTSGGYRGGDSDRDARVGLASRDAAQLAQLGQGNPRDAYTQGQPQPFGGVFSYVDAGEHLNSRREYYQFIQSNPQPRPLPFGQFVVLPTQPTNPVQLPNGFQVTLTSTAYGYDPVTRAFVTIRATSARPVVIREDDGVVSIERR
jgi:hypothetical protein